MALRVSSQVAAADPKASLTTALHALENALYDNEKVQYHVNSSVLGPSSVMTFVTQVDEDYRSRASRCVVPRLYTFLEKA